MSLREPLLPINEMAVTSANNAFRVPMRHDCGLFAAPAPQRLTEKSRFALFYPSAHSFPSEQSPLSQSNSRSQNIQTP